MILSEQILTMLFSFCWGFVYLLLYKMFKRYFLFFKYKILYNIMFNIVLFNVFLIGLIRINGGILHIYYVLFVIFGFFAVNKTFAFLCKV